MGERFADIDTWANQVIIDHFDDEVWVRIYRDPDPMIFLKLKTSRLSKRIDFEFARGSETDQ